MDVSIVIASYDTRDLLADCLESIRASEDAGACEVFVVDNGSTDGSAEMVAGQFPEVRLIRNDENLGFSRANNLALPRTSGRYVLLLNPDTRLRPNTLRDMTRLMDDRPDVGIAGVKLRKQDGEIDRACRRGFPTPANALGKLTGLDRVFPGSKTLGGYNLTWKNPDGEYEVDAVVGAFMFIRREVVDAVGMLDESFFMFGEDLDWCYRVKLEDWKVLYVGSQEILHVKGASTRRNPAAMNAHFHRAMLIFHKKHLDHRYPFFVNWLVSLGIGLRWAAKSLILAVRR